MKKIISSAFLLVIVSLLTVSAQEKPKVQKQTFLYSVKGEDSLYLDRYECPSVSGPKPCVIYVFGGGFVTGNRADIGNYADYLVGLGYSVVSIDYRLGLKGLSKGQKLNPLKFKDIFTSTLNIAVEDLFDATNFVIQHSGEWKINPEMIIVNGSSAGAIVALQSEYAICNKSDLASKLPKGFNYAGVISFAGAIYSTSGNLKWLETPVPIQLFHGDADANVPYYKMKYFYGSKYISDQLTKLKVPHYFYSVENASHELCRTPTTLNHEEIESFLKKLVKEKQHLIICNKVKPLDAPVLKKNFKMMDYIKANYKRGK